MNDITKQMTTQIPSGSGTRACGHDLGAISGRVALSGFVTTGVPVRDRHDAVVLGYADETPGSTAWRPPIT